MIPFSARFMVCTLLITGLQMSTGVQSSSAAKFNRVLELGDPAPAWNALPGTDGEMLALEDLKQAKAVVVVFWRNLCPVASEYEQRLIEFTARSRGRGVEVVAINVSHRPGETFESMRTHARERGFNFAYLRDESQKVARDYGATVTPHAFVLDRERKIAYMGAIDDHVRPDKVSTPYLQDAIDQLLGGNEVEIEESRQDGCEILYEPTVDLTIIEPKTYEETIQQAKGEVVLVDFWLTTCLQCRKQFPHTLELSKKHADQGLKVITMCLDDPKFEESDADFKKRLLKVLSGQKLTTANFAHRYVEGMESCEIYDINEESFPHYKLYDRQGKLIRKFYSDPVNEISFTLDELDAAVVDALKKR